MTEQVWYAIEYKHNNEWFESSYQADTEQSIRARLVEVQPLSGLEMRIIRKTLMTEVIPND